MVNEYSFSLREQDVIELLLQGKSNKQIAQALGISTSTVEFHLKNIYAKLQVNTKIEAVLKLSENQLGKSIGTAVAEKLRESTVDEVGKYADNNSKHTLRRISMKNIAYIIGGLSTSLLIVLFLFTNLLTDSTNVIPTAKASTDLPTAPIATSLTPKAESCVSVHEINFCVKGVALTKDFTFVMLEIKTLPNVQPDWMRFMLPTLGESNSLPILKDDQNKENTTVDADQSFMVFSGVNNETFLQTLKFPPLDQNVKSATLKFSFIGVYIPLQSSIQLDLGENPQPGQVISLDQTLNLQGQTIHLNKAELSSEGIGSLHIDIWSDPVELESNVIALEPRLGIPEGTGMSTGFGSKWTLSGSPYHAFAELSRPGNTPVSGLITIPVEGVSFYYQGNFEILFFIPESRVSSQIGLTLDQLAHIAEIRRFTGNPSLEPTFITFENVNNIWSAMYLVNDDSKYWVETQSRHITQFEIGKTPENVGAENKNNIELQSIAEEFAIENSLRFSQLHDDLVFSEKLEGNLHLFRWEYQKITIADVGSPFLQVIVSYDGKVVGYTNTIDFVGQ